MVSAFYNYNRVCSYNATYNFIVGPRGNGKTFGAKKLAIKGALYKGEEFIYLRRYKNELANSRNTFFADIAHLFPKWDFRIVGNRAQASPAKLRDAPKKEREWQTIGYFIALSTAQSQKSVSFPKVKRIIFDEFIIEKGNIRYLPDEVRVFNNFYSTVDRWQDRVTVFFLANSVSIMNPYFLEYEIRPDETGDLITKFNGFVCAHFPDSEHFRDQVYETKFGRFIANSEYGNFAIGNEFKDNHDSLIAEKTARSNPLYIIETGKGTFSVWYDDSEFTYFAQKRLPNIKRKFTTVPENMAEDKLLLLRNDGIMKVLRGAFRSANLLFDEASTRNAFAEICK